MVQVMSLSPNFTTTPFSSITSTMRCAIEAEDYSSYSGKLKVMTNNKNASGGKYVGDFDNLDCLSYKIQIEKAGNYQITLTVGTRFTGWRRLLFF